MGTDPQGETPCGSVFYLAFSNAAELVEKPLGPAANMALLHLRGNSDGAMNLTTIVKGPNGKTDITEVDTITTGCNGDTARKSRLRKRNN